MTLCVGTKESKDATSQLGAPFDGVYPGRPTPSSVLGEAGLRVTLFFFWLLYSDSFRKEMNMRTLVTLILFVASVAIGQTTYQLPFASSGNTIELAVANTAALGVAGVRVNATNVPTWLKFAGLEQKVGMLKPQQEAPATFSFSVDKMAPVKQNQTLKFVISAPTGETWTKEITIAVSSPEKFEVFQNYPNPFNPSTTISYQLTANSKVNLKIFNMLGQEVASLVDGDRLAGYHQEVWDATRCSSGVYVYQLVASDDHGMKQVARKRMMLLK